jgi:hypothetical protein
MNFRKPCKSVIGGVPHIWLQGWGYHPALPLSKLEAGMKIRFDGGTASEVLEVGREPLRLKAEVVIRRGLCLTKGVVHYATRTEGGKVYLESRRPSTLVAAFWPPRREN